ncbi:MAG: arylsulfatase [Phycisphaeraceae bacterium]|nr:arylsulfatase [Phycisphaeraceae bacterium]
MPDRPNIVLICADQWRGDCLSIAGHPVVRTPNLDDLALRGTRFTRAYSATPACIAARASLLTGLRPTTHGRVGYQDGVPWNYPVTLAGEFSRHGYQTQAVGKMHVFPERHRMGFDHVTLHDGYLHFARQRTRHDIEQADDYLPWLRLRSRHDVDYLDNGLNCNSYNVRPWDKDESLHPTNFIAGESIDFLRRRDPTSPFFLFMSFHRPHPPLDPPAWAFEQYLHRDMPDPSAGDWADYFARAHSPHKPDLGAGRLPPDLLQRARAGYYGHMTHIDTQIRRFIEVLMEYRLLHNTWFCFVSDHGDLLGDHHLWRKSLPYEGSARVPLILAPPPTVKLPRNAACHAVAELRDVMPTLLDCAGLPIPDAVEGRSLLPHVRGEQGVPWRSHLHGEHTYHLCPEHAGSAHYLTDGREKYIWFSNDGHEQLFDLDADPHETHDLARDPAQQHRVERWRRQLTDELKGREEGFVDEMGRLLPGRAVHPCLSFLRQ